MGSCDNREMADTDNPHPREARPWTRADEENELLEVSEERRLRRLGIDPDAPLIEIWTELKRRMKIIEAETEEAESQE